MYVITGIQVKMITGDHPETAAAIAKKLGIVDPSLPDNRVVKITGPELDNMSPDQLDDFVMKCNVFARASPENKLQILKSLQRIGQTASMTGTYKSTYVTLEYICIDQAVSIAASQICTHVQKYVQRYHIIEAGQSNTKITRYL
jgi:hypothetical protein